MMDDGKRVDRRTRVLEFRDDEATEYAILSHRWIDPTKVDYEEMVTLPKMKFVVGLATRRYWIPASRQRRTGMSRYGLILAASTSEAAQSCLKPSIQCIGGTQTRGYAMRFSATFLALSFPLRKTMKSIPTRMAGRSGFRVGGRYRR